MLTCLEEHWVVAVVLEVLLLLLLEFVNNNEVASMVSGDTTYNGSSLIKHNRIELIADIIWWSSDDSIVGSSFLGCLDARV